MKKLLCFVLALAMLAGFGSALAMDVGEARAVIGADLTDDQISVVYESFGIERGSVTELTVTNAEERQYLEGLVDNAMIGTRSISCVYIEILEEGSGLEIATNNISWCTENVYINALATAGIADARVIVSSPIAGISGTAALTGIYKAYEDITGEELDDVAKLVGTQELVITQELADEIGSYDAAAIVNELKLILAETENMTDDEIRAEILRIAADYDVALTDGQVDQLIELCRSLEKMGADELLNTVQSVQNTIQKLAEAQSTAQRVISTVKEFISSVGEFFDKILSFFGL